MTRARREKSLQIKVAGMESGIVFGYGIVSNERDGNGDLVPYLDLQNDHIPEEVVLKGMVAFMEGNRVAKAQHKGESIGKVVYGFPLTADTAKALGITEYEKTGFIIGMKPNADVLEGFKSGEYTGFSLGGYLTSTENENG